MSELNLKLVVGFMILQFHLGSAETLGSSGVYSKAAVATDAAQCSTIGVDILKRGGSAVDSAIASLLCVGVVNLHSTGIGGGGFMIVYLAASEKTYALDYRETAPDAATFDMYKGNPNGSIYGGLSVAVPAELRGLEMAWKKWGKLEWKELFQPAIELARQGYPVSPAISNAIQNVKDILLAGGFPGLSELLAPNGTFLKEGDILKRPLYADTLEMIATSGADSFYSGGFMKDAVNELKEDYGSILTEQDFEKYTIVDRDVTQAKYKGLEVMGVAPPASGAVLSLILNILDNYNFSSSDFGDLSYHRMVEAFKFTYAQRLQLGDPAFNKSVDAATKFMEDSKTASGMFSLITDDKTHPQDYYNYHQKLDFTGGDQAHDHGTSHLSVLAENGDAVACTSTVNFYFGSLIRSRKNGVIFNNEMDDFSYPSRNSSTSYRQTIANYIAPGKRPMSSTSPTIVLDNGSVKMVVGASGGFFITTSVVQVILDVLAFGKPLNDSISLARLHHQLFPDYIRVESTFPADIQGSLKSKGHDIVAGGPLAVVQGIYKDDGQIYATSDERKGGKPDGY